MKNLGFRLSCAALVFASAGCIIDRDVVRDDRGSRQSAPSEIAPPPPPPTRAPDPTPAPAAPAKNPSAMASNAPAEMGAPTEAEVKANAQRADAELAREGQKHGGAASAETDESGAAAPTISNVDAAGNKMAAPSPFEEDDSPQEGAPGANASPQELARAWPGARPFDGVIGGGANDPAGASAARPPALPYSPGEADSASMNDESQPPTSNQMVTNETPPPPGTEVDPDQFQKPLRSYGRWVTTPDYGRVWIPYVDNDWQPYSDGTWTNTEYGWTFTSYDPWGWAVWHYGSWGFRAGVGWYWVPGRVWAPAWVSWRWGGGYACWRPIAPWGVWGARWGTRGWVSVQAAHFTEPIHGFALQRQQVGVAITRAAPLPGPTAHPIAGGSFGPPVNAVSQATGHPVASQPAAQVMHASNAAARSAAAQANRAGGMQSAARPAFSAQGEQARAQNLARSAPAPQTEARTRNSASNNRSRGNGRPNGGARANGARQNARGGNGHANNNRGGGHGGGGHGGSGHKHK